MSARNGLAVAVVTVLAAFLGTRAGAGDPAPSLLEARKGFETKLSRVARDGDPLQAPPPALFSVVSYRSPAGRMAAYLGKAPSEGAKHPAIVWVTGGFPPGGIGHEAWQAVPAENDQSAKVYRLSGVVMMYPTFRGSFGNPGRQESFFGEVDDVLAALKYLRDVDYVDPERIYLGGHSTGGTLALLAAAATDGFRAVFAFGPVDAPASYGAAVLTYDPSNEKEEGLRSPIRFLDAIRCPTFVIEGTKGNAGPLAEMRKACRNDKVRFLQVNGANHFDVLAPANAVIARQIATLTGDGPVGLDRAEIQGEFDVYRKAAREGADLQTLAALRRARVELGRPQPTRHYLWSTERANLAAAAKGAKALGFATSAVERREGEEGEIYFLLVLDKRVTLKDLDAVFAASKSVRELADANGVEYDGWTVAEQD